MVLVTNPSPFCITSATIVAHFLSAPLLVNAIMVTPCPYTGLQMPELDTLTLPIVTFNCRTGSTETLLPCRDLI
jgi:hypothetical protein